MKDRRAVVLLSGGLDSAVAATIAKCERFDLYMLTFDYGQRHKKEIEAAKAVAQSLRAKEHKILPVPLGAFGGSALTDRSMDVPKNRSMTEIATGIPQTYVPARNTIFLAFGLAWAETLGAQSIFIGAHALDYSGYPDCRPEYFDAFNELAKLATKIAIDGKPVRIHAPLVGWTKTKIVETGMDLKAPLNLTWSCYEGGDVACGACDSCQLRLRAFAEAGANDPVPYAGSPAAPTPSPVPTFVPDAAPEAAISAPFLAPRAHAAPPRLAPPRAKRTSNGAGKTARRKSARSRTSKKRK